MKYNELNTKERGDVILMHIKAGITKLSDIEKSYNEFAEGGLKNQIPVIQNSSIQAHIPQSIQSFKASNDYLEKLRFQELQKQSKINQGTLHGIAGKDPNLKEFFSNKDGALGIPTEAYKDAGKAFITAAPIAAAGTLATPIIAGARIAYGAGTAIAQAPIFGNSAATISNLGEAFINADGAMNVPKYIKNVYDVYTNNKSSIQEKINATKDATINLGFSVLGGAKLGKEALSASTHITPFLKNAIGEVKALKFENQLTKKTSTFMEGLDKIEKVKVTGEKGKELTAGESETPKNEFAFGGNLFSNGGNETVPTMLQSPESIQTSFVPSSYSTTIIPAQPIVKVAPKIIPTNIVQQKDALYVDTPSIIAPIENKVKTAEDNKYRENAKVIENKKTSIDNIIGLGGLDKNEVKIIQQDLLDKGLLTNREIINVNKLKTKDSIEHIQSLLVKKGYDLGNYGKNKDGVDGILGNHTSKALEDYNKDKTIDGIVGDNTIKAFNTYKNTNSIDRAKDLDITHINKDTELLNTQNELQSQGFFKNKKEDFNYNTDNIILRKIDNNFKINQEDKTPITQCTKYIGDQVQTKIGAKERERIGLFGDAWTIRDNMVAKGAEEIYTVFPKNKPNTSNPANYINELTKNKPNLKSDDVSNGDIVTLYYGGSPSADKAYKSNGTNFSTHAGIVKIDNTGAKYIEHNVHGHIYKEPLENFLNNKVKNAKGLPVRITGIVRPDYKNNDEGEVFDNTDNNINFKNVNNTQTPLGSKNAADFNQVILNNKEKLLQDIPINNDEFKGLSKALKVIGWKESRYENNPKTEFKTIVSNLREDIIGKESSEGITQLKDEKNLNSVLRTNLKVDNNTLKDPKTDAIPSFYSLATKYLAIKKSMGKDTNFSADDLSQLALISWNEPINKVIATANKYKNLKATVKAYQDDYGYDEKGNTKFPYNTSLTAYNQYIN